jgi:hypothetical protein
VITKQRQAFDAKETEHRNVKTLIRAEFTEERILTTTFSSWSFLVAGLPEKGELFVADV